MIKGFNFRKEKLLLLWHEGVDEGLSSLLLQCLGIETMHVPHQRVYSKAYCKLWYRFRHPPSRGLEFVNREFDHHKNMKTDCI